MCPDSPGRVLEHIGTEFRRSILPPWFVTLHKTFQNSGNFCEILYFPNLAFID